MLKMSEAENQQMWENGGNADRGCDEKSAKAEQMGKCWKYLSQEVSKCGATTKMLTISVAKSQQMWENGRNADRRYDEKSAKININDHADSKILKNDL